MILLRYDREHIIIKFPNSEKQISIS